MDDAPGLASIINTLLPYDVRRKIEAQVINGDGTGQNLTGILKTPGVASVPAEAGDNPADVILRLITTIILSDHDPNFVALHPLDWQDLLLLREDNTARTGMYLFGGPGSMASPTIWGLPATPTTQMVQGQPLVGDSNGSTLLVREGVNVKTSDSDQDDFVKNRVTVLAEARVAYLVWYPSAFAVGEAPAGP
jgi:HK97 family phage major capsid protein